MDRTKHVLNKAKPVMDRQWRSWMAFGLLTPDIQYLPLSLIGVLLLLGSYIHFMDEDINYW